MTTASPCPGSDALQELLLGLLSDAEVEGVEAHLAQCGHCLREVQHLQATDALAAAVREGARGSPIPTDAADPALVDRLYHLWQAGGTTADISNRTPPAPEADAEGYDFLTPPQGPDEIGSFGPYGILRRLGAGGMGVVFLARQRRPQRLVALKVLPPGSGGGQRLARFRDEAEVIARLEHPHIVQVFEVGEHQGRPCFAMEYLKGGSLAQKLAAAPLTPRDAACVVRTLAQAMHHTHVQGILHRDLKPANVLLSADGQPKITDFGLAKQFQTEADTAPGQRTDSGVILGTPAYMAPEQAAGRAVGPAADVYALGAILYECLTGRPPFRAASLLQTLDLVRSQDPVPPGRLQPGLPRDLQTICLKCLEKDPVKRYISAEALTDDLGRFLRGEPILARPVSVRERLWKWARRKPAAAALVGASGLFLIVLVAGALLYQDRLRQAVKREQASGEQARRQQARADANYQQAVKAVQQMLSRLEERGMAGTPRLMELQRQQLEDALTFYQEVLKGQDDPDPAVRFDASRAYIQTAVAQITLGQGAPAIDNLRRAQALLEALVAEHPEEAEYRGRLASCLLNLSNCPIPRPQAEEQIRQARDLLERLVAEHPDVAGWHNELATSYMDLGRLFQTNKQPGRAVPEYLRAVAIRTRLTRELPDVARYKSQLAGNYVNLGLAQHQTGHPAEADKAFQAAEALLDPLSREHPQELSYALSLAALYANWTLVPADGPDKLAAVLARLNKAVTLAEWVHRQEPQFPTASNTVLQVHGARAYVHQAMKHWADAVPDWDRVIELAAEPERTFRRGERAAALANAGQHARAAAEAESLLKGSPSDRVLFNLAVTYTSCMTAARADSHLSAAQKAAVEDRYGAQVVALLRRLHARGFFKDAYHRRLLKDDDPNANPLWARADYRELIHEIESGAAAPPGSSGSTVPKKP
jgi:tetratricopeptide (TPR) repeat protein